MDTLVLHTHVSADGHVTFLLPAEFANQAIEVVVRRASKLSTTEWSVGAVQALDKGVNGDGKTSDGELEKQDGVE